MAKFYKDCLTFKDLVGDKTLVHLSKCLELIEESEFKSDLIKLYDFDKIKDETLTITGLNKVIKSIITRDKEFKKVDLNSHISKVLCTNFLKKENVTNIKLLFKGTKDTLGVKSIEATTVYSAKKDYFEGSYKMDKFANFCIAEGHFDILKTNIELLNERYKNSKRHHRSYRLLQDREGNYFVRAITSVSHYHDYNIRFSLFAMILALHKVLKGVNYNFEISRCEYSESFIRVFFEKDITINIPDIGKLKFVLEMSNDEIKKGAFKLSGVFTLISNQTDGVKTAIFLKPKKVKTDLISIKHNSKLSTVTEKLENLATFIKDIEDEMTRDIVDIANMKNVDELRFTLLRSIENSKNTELNNYKEEIKKQLGGKINKINDLLLLLGKVDSIVKDSDLEAKEYLRYLFYEILRDKKAK